MARAKSAIMIAKVPTARRQKGPKLWNLYEMNSGNPINTKPIEAKNEGEAAIKFLGLMEQEIRKAE